MEELFAKGDTTATFRSHTDKLIDKINNFSDEKILGADFCEWTNYFFNEYKIHPITLYMDNVIQNLSETKVEKYNVFSRHDRYDPEYFLIDGYKVTFVIPFDGDSELLYLKPSHYIMTRFLVDQVKNSNEKSFGEIVFSLEYTKRELEEKETPKEFIALQFSNQFKNYIEMVNYVNIEVENYNKSLESTIKNALDVRKKKADDYVKMGEILDIPLKINPNAPNTTPILLKKAVAKKTELPSIKKPEKEYQIASMDYENIKRVINLAGFSMEKTAKTFIKLSEEELRDIIISNLNTHYQGLASGETFSKAGKTDIHILFENKAAYVGECKIWHGEKNLQDAINQLFSYITWRDLKTSIIIFNKENKNFSKILSTITSFLKANTMCHKYIPVSRNEWLCEFKRDIDSTEYVMVQIVIFDICTDT